MANLIGGKQIEVLNDVSSSATELNILDGVTSTTAELNIMDGVTSTAAELNIMDGVTSTAAELNIMDGVTASAAELNTSADGSTSAGTTAVAGSDGLVTNDGGTMRQTTVDTFDTYLSATTKTLTNKTLTSPTLTTPALGTPASGVMTNMTGAVTASLVDDAVTLAKMASGTDGNIISYDASGNPVAIATGSDGQVLTSTGAGSAPAFEDAGGGGGGLTFIVRAALSGTSTGTTFSDLYVTGGNVTYRAYKIFLTEVIGDTNGDSINIYFVNTSGTVQTANYEMTLSGRANDGNAYSTNYNGAFGHFCVNHGTGGKRGLSGEYILTGLEQGTDGSTITVPRFVGTQAHNRSDQVTVVGSVTVSFNQYLDCAGFQLRSGTGGNHSFSAGHCTVFGINES